VSLSNHLRLVLVDWPWNTEMPIRNMRGRGDKAKAEVAFRSFSARCWRVLRERTRNRCTWTNDSSATRSCHGTDE
jgi:hypothetical protein